MLKYYKRWKVYVKTRNELLQLNAKELLDIGLYSGDIHEIAKQEAILQHP